MIIATITETNKHLVIECTGHSMGTDEPCARMSTTLDLIKVFMTRFISDSTRKNGYTYLKIIKSPLSEENLVSAITYLQELSNLYPAHIQIIERKN